METNKIVDVIKSIEQTLFIVSVALVLLLATTFSIFYRVYCIEQTVNILYNKLVEIPEKEKLISDFTSDIEGE